MHGQQNIKKCWSNFKYFVILIVSTNYTFVHNLDTKVFIFPICKQQEKSFVIFPSQQKLRHRSLYYCSDFVYRKQQVTQDAHLRAVSANNNN